MPPPSMLPYVFYDQRHQDFHFEQTQLLQTTHELISLCLTGSNTGPRYTAVWWKVPRPRDQLFIDVDSVADLTAALANAASVGFSPILIAAVDDPAIFSVTCVRVATGPVPSDQLGQVFVGLVDGSALTSGTIQFWNAQAKMIPAAGSGFSAGPPHLNSRKSLRERVWLHDRHSGI